MLAILHQGTSAGQIGVSSNLISFGGTNVATFSGGTGTNALVVNFTNAMTVPAAQALVRRLTFKNLTGTVTNLTRTLRMAINDGRGGTNNPLAYINVSLPYVDAGPDRTGIASYSLASTGQTLVALSAAELHHPVAITYCESAKQFVFSENWTNGNPFTFATVSSNGSVASLLNSVATNLSGEILMTTVSDEGGGTNRGGFRAGDIFCGTGATGQIARLSTNLTFFERNWLTLSNADGIERGSLAGGLCIDRSGVFGGDLIICTTAGGVWRVNSSKVATKLATVTNFHGSNVVLEGLITVPNDPVKYGPWAGKIVAGAEDQVRTNGSGFGLVFTISTNGIVTDYDIGIGVEDIAIIPPNENLFAVDLDYHVLLGSTNDYSALWGGAWPLFTGMAGDFLVSDESTQAFHRVWWNGTNFQVTNIFTNQIIGEWEHITFSPAGIAEIPAVDSSLILTGHVYSPPGCTLSLTWSSVSGPGPVGFTAPNSNITAVAFCGAGTNVLRLSVTGCGCTNEDLVTVIVTNTPHPPSIFITSPTNGQFFTSSPTNVAISAMASDCDGTVTNVEFFQGTNRLNLPVSVSNHTYTINWRPVFGGPYTLTARASDNSSLNATSAPVNIVANFPPAVSITNLTNGQPFTRLTNILIQATASDVETNGSVVKVEFFQGTNLIGTATNALTNALFSLTWSNPPAGSHTLFARATDNLGTAANSHGVSIVVYEVNTPPVVNAGPDQTNRLPNAVFLAGSVSDDGLPHGSTLSIAWTNVSGPSGGVVTFLNSNVPATTATFSKTGAYVLQLSASDTQFTVSSSVTNTVLTTNNPPEVNAGSDQTIVWPALGGTTNLVAHLTAITTPFTSLYGIDYSSPSNRLIAFATGASTNLALLSPDDGSATLFSSITNLSHEDQVAAVRQTLGGFTPGESFIGGSSTDFGEIYRVNTNGMLIGTNGTNGNIWVVLPGAGAGYYPSVTSGIYVDRTGVFGGDLIVATGAGYVWRISSSGATSLLARVSTTLDEPCVTTIPNDVKKYGPWAGRILVSDADSNDGIYAVDTNGVWLVYPLSNPETMGVIPANANFFAVQDGDSRFWNAPAAQFEGKAGDIFMGESGGDIYAVRWSGEEFRKTLIFGADGFYNWRDWEQVCFAPVGFTNFPSLIDSVQLSGVVTDNDGLINTNPIITWSKVSGPAAVTFDDPAKTNTIARFTEPGVYVLRLVADDGELEGYDEMTIQILRNQPPVINSASNRLFITTNATLTAIVNDDGWPSNQLAISWSLVSGPAGGAALFGTTNLITNSALVWLTNSISFSATGTYVVQITASDGQANSGVQVLVTVGAPQLTLTPEAAGVALTNTSQTFSARLIDDTGSPIAYTNIQFSVTGANAAIGIHTNQTDAGGLALFSYVGAAAGRDFIRASAVMNGRTNSSAPSIADWALVLHCGQTNDGTLSATDALDSTLSADPRLADFFFLSGQMGSMVNLKTVTTNDRTLIVTLSDLSHHVLDFSYGDYHGLVTTLPYSGTFLAELTTLKPNITNISYTLTMRCETNVLAPMLGVLLNGTNLPNGGTLTMGPTVTNVPVTNSLVVTNLGGRDIYADVEALSIQPPFVTGATGDFTATLGSTYLEPATSTTLQIIFKPKTNGVSIGMCSMTNNANPGQFVLSLIGQAFPTGSPPSIVLTSPATNSSFFAPADIPISASVTTGSTSIAYVSLQASSTDGLIQIAASSNATWRSVSVGDYTITGIAVDAVGRSAVSAPVTIHVLDPHGNRPPIATNDLFNVLANSSNNVLYPLANDYDTNGDALIIVANTVPRWGTASIVNGGGAIMYSPPAGRIGFDWLTYQISDGRGGTAWGNISIKIYPDGGPQVWVASPPSGFSTNAGAVMPISAEVDSPAEIASVEFYLGPSRIGTVTNGTNGVFLLANWTATAHAGEYEVFTRATDILGQVATSESIVLNVTPPAGSGAPAAVFDAFVTPGASAPATNQMTIREGLVDLYGRAYYSVAGTNVAWQLGVYNPDGTLALDLTPPPLTNNGAHLGAIGSSSASNRLAACDFSGLENGVYDLKLAVTGGFQMTNTTVRFRLESNLKIGQFSFSQQDLVIPVNGIPLTVVRTYNSLNRARGDFGYGWTYAVNAMNIVIDEVRDDQFLDFENDPFSQRTGGGRDVTLTLPNGQRTTFFFALTQVDVSSYSPQWIAAPGVTARLANLGALTMVTIAGAPYWQDPELGIGVADDVYDFPGFILTTLDGTQYVIKRADLGVHDVDDGGLGYSVHAWGRPFLSQIVQRTLDTITINGDSIVQTNAAGLQTRKIVFQRNADGLISAISDPNALDADGHTNGPPAVKYEYNNQQNLINVLRLTDRATGKYVTNSFSYANLSFPHYITGMIDGRGVTATRNEYDEQGRIIATMDSAGNSITCVHNLDGRNETITDRLGHTNVVAYDSRGNVVAATNAIGGVTLMAYDSNNNLTDEITVIDGAAYATNHAVFASTGLLLAKTSPSGRTTAFTYNDFGQVLTINSDCGCGGGVTNFYNASGNLTGNIDALGNTSANFFGDQGLLLGSRDFGGLLTTNYYDDLGNLTSTAALLVNGASVTILSSNSFAYDANLNVTNAVTWRKDGSVWIGATNRYVYDALNRLVQSIDPLDAANMTVYNELGQVVATIDPLGRITQYEYDELGRTVATIYPDNSVARTEFDAEGQITNSVDRAGRTTSFVRDELGRVTAIVFPDDTTNRTVFDQLGRVRFAVSSRGVTNASGYDVLGRRIAETNALGTSVQAVTLFAPEASGNQATVTDPLNHTTTTFFDALHRPFQILRPDNTSVSMQYDPAGNRIAETSPDGITNRFGFDGFERLVVVTNAAGKVTQYQFDQTGNQLLQTDSMNRTNRSEFDLIGRRIKRTLANGQFETFGYDLVGNGVRHTNFNGQVITNEFDIMNRLTNITSGGGYQIAFSYSVTGLRTQMVDSAGTHSYFYDARDRLTNYVGPAGALRYLYDSAGNMTNVASSTPNGVSVLYQYDALGRMTNVIDLQLAGSQVTSYGLDSAGNPLTVKYPNGVTNLARLDVLNRLTNLTWKLNGTVLADFTYVSDLAGKRTNANETIGGTSRTFNWQFDVLDRLTNEVVTGTAPTGALAYAYDDVGNRLSRRGTLGTIVGQTNQFDNNDRLDNDSDPATPSTFFDANGNATNHSGPFRFSAENRLTNANSGAVLIIYDGNGNRVKKIAGGVTNLYLVDPLSPSGNPQVLEELAVGAGATNLVVTYTYGRRLISQRRPGVATNFYGFDGHGSVLFLLDSAGNVAATYTYDAFGTLIQTSGSATNNYLYCGEQFDSDLGRYYLRERYLNPDLGRFLTADPAAGNDESPSSLHKYAYVHGDPVNNVDPSGLDEVGLAELATPTVRRNVVTRTLARSGALTAVAGQVSLSMSVIAIAATINGGNDNVAPAFSNSALTAMETATDEQAVRNACITLAQSKPNQNQYFYTQESHRRATGAAAVLWRRQDGQDPKVDPPGWRAADKIREGSVHRGHLIPFAYGGKGDFENITTQEQNFNQGLFRSGFQGRINARFRDNSPYVCILCRPKYNGVGKTGVRDPGRPVAFGFNIWVVTPQSWEGGGYYQPELFGNWADDISPWNTWNTGVVSLNY